MNAHDFTTPIKTQLVEKLAEVLPGDLTGFQFYDAGTAAVEAGLRVMRAATGKNEILSCFYDFHGKTYGAVSLAQIPLPGVRPRPRPGMHMVPRPDTYRPMWTKADGTIDTDEYLAFYDEYIDKATVHDVAGFCLEPIQGWGGSVMPPDDFFPKLRQFCDERGLLLMADEVLTSWGRTGKWLCMEHWGVAPDIVTHRQGLRQRLPRDRRGRARSITRKASRRSPPLPATAAIPWPAPRRWRPPKSSRKKTCSNMPSTWANVAHEAHEQDAGTSTASSAMCAPRAA